MFGLVEDERIFSAFAIIKDKLCNQLGPHLEMTICMFGQEFFTKNNFSYHDAIKSWKKQKNVNWCYHLKMGVGPWLIFLCLNVFVSTI